MKAFIHHVAVVVQNIEKSVEFYDRVFGFPHIKRLTEGVSKNRGAWYQVGELELHLQERTEPTAKTEQHVAFLTDDLDEIVRRVEQNGGRSEDAKLINGVSKRRFVYDLDSNRIELLQR